MTQTSTDSAYEEGSDGELWAINTCIYIIYLNIAARML